MIETFGFRELACSAGRFLANEWSLIEYSATAQFDAVTHRTSRSFYSLYVCRLFIVHSLSLSDH